MANPRIEEISDDDDNGFADDPDEMDLDAFDFAKPQGSLQPKNAAEHEEPELSAKQKAQMQALLDESRSAPTPSYQTQPTEQQQREAQEASKSYQCIYPIYFDSTRSKAQGRRVSRKDAVPNPLAREIVDAVSAIAGQRGVGLRVVFEPFKTHPKDWANPGRVRVLLKKDGRAVSGKIANKHYLYKLIAEYLKAHPTTPEMAQRYRMQGMPPMKEAPPAPAVPRGFKIGTILPMHSPALSGGGVSDNFFGDMMAEMGGQLPPGMEGMAGMVGAGAGAGGAGGGQQVKKVKDKKKK
ncbi:hypothetical protein LTR62_008057 [Meristemomyces frigidus]|uniref:Signal recognition particle SEC65 subunit n=1 Tax=Meristemomyces frigidus TaxID=1508187 RepID=A0AAN7TM89_9PEZI|nr:hypothetical protein LTR62_008057 [Meristemomyces frigidus]